MTQDDQRAVAALISAGRTLNAWREPIRAVERELDIPTESARAMVESLQHRGVVRIKREKTSGFPLESCWVCCRANPAGEGGAG